MDHLTKERRSWNMSRIRSRDTKPERIARSVLHHLGFRFRLNSGDVLPGKPDVVLPKYKTVIFVHGCFWHRHHRCRLAYIPKSRVSFWTQKFTATVLRDKKMQRKLRSQGWRVVTVWECETHNIDALAKTFLRKVDADQHSRHLGRVRPKKVHG